VSNSARTHKSCQIVSLVCSQTPTSVWLTDLSGVGFTTPADVALTDESGLSDKPPLPPRHSVKPSRHNARQAVSSSDSEEEGVEAGDITQPTFDDLEYSPERLDEGDGDDVGRMVSEGRPEELPSGLGAFQDHFWCYFVMLI
jgi:hypothetical protein